MKKIFSLILATILLFSSGIMVLPAFAAEALPANTVVVDKTLGGTSGSTANVTVGGKTYSVTVGDTGFTTITAALDALPAGGTLLLASGEYTEEVVIQKNVTILGPKAGIDPNVKGTKATDDWTRNSSRGTGEAVIKGNWHIGVKASTMVYDCDDFTIDGVMVSGSGMFRSNYGETGNITLNYKNILVSGFTGGNAPFYCYSYYPNTNPKTNNYSRILNAENIRFEGLTTAKGFDLNVDGMIASGIYFDSACTTQMFDYITMSTSAQSGVSITYTVKDSMFRQKSAKLLNCNLQTGAGGHSFNKNIANCTKVTMNITGNVFANNDSAAANNNNIIVPQINTDNVYFNISNNYFIQSGTASANLIAVQGNTGSLALGEKFTVSQNRFINIPTALSIKNSTTEFDLSGNYFENAEGMPQKPVVEGKDKTEWWYMNADLTKTSEQVTNEVDGVPVTQTGAVDTTAKTLTDSVSADTYTVSVSTENYNTFKLYSDEALTKELANPVKLYSETNTFYIKIMSANGQKQQVYTATVNTTAPDLFSFDIENELRWMGRTYSVSGNHFFNWSASGFEFCFKGSGATAQIASNAPGGSHSAYIKIYVDGKEMPDVKLTQTLQTVTLARDLDPNTVHTVRVVKRTNARSSSAALVSLTLTDGKKLPPPAAKTRLIEFIGDSITVGYSTLAGNATTWSTATEDATKTYSAQIANAFDADYMVTAISGRGIVRNTDATNTLLAGEIYQHTDIYNDPDTLYGFEEQPDLIVINLGTNDASYNNNNILTAEQFRAGMKEYVQLVRAKNPDAEILYVYGILSTKFITDMEAVINELIEEGDEKLSFMRLASCSDSERSIGHPTAAAYVSRGEAMIERISQRMGWVAGEVVSPPYVAPDDD